MVSKIDVLTLVHYKECAWADTKRALIFNFLDILETIGGFPNETKTKIRYLIIFCYQTFIL